VEFPSATDTETKSARPPAQLDGVELVIIQRRFRSVNDRPIGLILAVGKLLEEVVTVSVGTSITVTSGGGWQRLGRYHGNVARPVGVGGVAGSVVEGRSDGEGDGVAGIFDEVDDVAVMEPRNVVVVDRQDSVADLQPRAALRRTLPDDR